MMSDQLFNLPDLIVIIVSKFLFISWLFYIYLKKLRTKFILLYIIFLVIFFPICIIMFMFPEKYIADFISRTSYVPPILLSVVFFVWTMMVANRLRRLRKTDRKKGKSIKGVGGLGAAGRHKK